MSGFIARGFLGGAYSVCLALDFLHEASVCIAENRICLALLSEKSLIFAHSHGGGVGTHEAVTKAGKAQCTRTFCSCDHGNSDSEDGRDFLHCQ
jgi:hypothetical protein